MTDGLYRSNGPKLFVLLVIIINGSSSHTAVDKDVWTANVTGYHVTAPSEEFLSSSISVTGRSQANAKVQQLSINDGTKAVSSLVGAPVEVIGSRSVESGTPGKAERKRESGTTPVSVESRNAVHECVLTDDMELREDNTGVVPSPANRGTRPKVSARGEDEKYDNDESGGSRIMDDEGGDGDDDDDDDDDKVAVDDEKIHRNLRRKAGRHYRQGPKIWDQWGKWTSCSVSCGAGKLTRWRHCVAGGCSVGEKEAQLKTCTFSAC